MGFFDDELEFKGNKTLKGVLQDFGNDLQKRLRKNLANKVKSFTSKRLQQSIRFEIKIGQGAYIFELKMEDYWKYINEGVQGATHQGGEYAARKVDSEYYSEPAGTAWRNKAPNSPFKFTTKPPRADDLRQWANVVGLNVYQVQRTIFVQGIKPNKFYDEIVNEDLLQDLIIDLEKHAKKAIELELAETLKGHAK